MADFRVVGSPLFTHTVSQLLTFVIGGFYSGRTSFAPLLTEVHLCRRGSLPVVHFVGFDACMKSCTHHSRPVPRSFPAPSTRAPPVPPSPFPSDPWQPGVSLPSPYFASSGTSQSSNHTARGDTPPWAFTAAQLARFCAKRTTGHHPPAEGPRGCSQVLAVTSTAAVDSHVQVSVWTEVLDSLGKYHGRNVPLGASQSGRTVWRPQQQRMTGPVAPRPHQRFVQSGAGFWPSGQVCGGSRCLDGHFPCGVSIFSCAYLPSVFFFGDVPVQAFGPFLNGSFIFLVSSFKSSSCTLEISPLPEAHLTKRSVCRCLVILTRSFAGLAFLCASSLNKSLLVKYMIQDQEDILLCLLPPKGFPIDVRVSDPLDWMAVYGVREGLTASFTCLLWTRLASPRVRLSPVPDVYLSSLCRHHWVYTPAPP